MDTESFFKGKRPIGQKLKAFGFCERGDDLFFARPVGDGSLRLEISVGKDLERAAVHTRVVDPDTGEEYVLHLVDDAQGAFVGQVREDVEHILQEIARQCFDGTPVPTKNTAAVLRYARERYGSTPEFLWEDTPNTFILRRSDNKKWYAAFLTIPKSKLGDFPAGDIGVLNVKAPPEEIARLTDGKRFFPAWHMNKRHWLSLPLDGTLPLETLFERLDVSYRAAGTKKDKTRDEK